MHSKREPVLPCTAVHFQRHYCERQAVGYQAGTDRGCTGSQAIVCPACAAQIGVIYGNPEVTSGGNALKFYASVRLEVRRKMTHESAKGESTGIRVKAKVGGPGHRKHPEAK